MIVKICDSCQKLLFDAADCQWVAVRERGALMLKKWQAGMADKASVSHFCGKECALGFCGEWLEGKLVEPKQEPYVLPAEHQDLQSHIERVTAPPVEVRPATAQEQAEQNAILRSLGV